MYVMRNAGAGGAAPLANSKSSRFASPSATLLPDLDLPLEPYTGGSVCSGADHARWRWWAAISAVRMCFATVVVLKRRRLELASDMPRRARLARITSLNTMRNALDAVNLIWFVIGNM